MKKKAIPPFTLTAGQSGRLLFDFTLPPGAETPALRGALMVHGERVDMEGTQEDMLVIPALPAGVYLAEVRAAGMCVLYGHVEVLPSPLSGEEGLATFRVDVDNTTDVLQVNIAMLEGLTGPQGLSAYDVAQQNGFAGTESEWLESLKKDSAEYAAQVVESYLGQARQAAADALNAQGVAEAAREGAQVAQGVAEAAQVAADDAAGVAAGSAEAAVKAAEEAKAAEAGSAAAADVVRYDFLPMTLEWLDSRFTKTLGEGKFSMTYTEEENTLRVAFALETTEAQIEEARALLRVLPRNLVIEMEWADGLPVTYTRLEYLENTSTQYLVLPVEYGQTSGLSLSYKVKPHSWYSYLSIIRFGDKSVQFGRIYADGQTGIAISLSSTTTAHVKNNGKIFAAYNEYESGKIKVASPDEKREIDIPEFAAEGSITPVYIFAYDTASNSGVYIPSAAHYSLYEARLTLGQQLVNRYVPALDPTGTPCLYDTVTREPSYNSGTGQFIAGIETQKQLDAVMRSLPDRSGQDGGELHLCLSDALYESAVASGLIETTATAKNWQIAYDPTTTEAA